MSETAALQRIHAAALAHHAIAYTLLRTTGATRVSVSFPGHDVATANRFLGDLAATHRTTIRTVTHDPRFLSHQTALVDGVVVTVKHVPRPAGVAMDREEGAA
jgi:hypothetical protein